MYILKTKEDTRMRLQKKMKKFAKVLAASLVVTSFCPTFSGLPLQVNSSVEVQAAVKAKTPSCVASQTVYVVASFGGPNAGDEAKNVFGLPDCYIFIKNLSSNAKITNIKSSNKKIKAIKRDGMNALELSAANPSQPQNLVGASSTISFRVTQNGKTYKLSCKIKVAERKSPFAKFTVGSEDYAQYFDGYMYVNADKLKGKKKVYVKTASGIVLDSINISYTQGGKFKTKSIKNGSTVNLTTCRQISVSYHMTKKPANYTAPTKWYGVVASPLYDYNTLIFE